MPQSAENGIEVFLYTAERDLDSLIKSLDLTLIQDPHIARIPISTICVLPDQHPAIRLYERRQNSGLYPSGWPWGLAALDAIDHADARVRQAAEDAWRDWLDSQDMEATKARTRNG